jgi:transcriptional regulator with XRE-family HTH domain
VAGTKSTHSRSGHVGSGASQYSKSAIQVPGGTSVASHVAEKPARGFISTDPYRSLIFPNSIREQRRKSGCESLLMLAGQLPNIPYIRLSKIERGEVVAKAHELTAIANALGVTPVSLLADVDNPDFNIAFWAGMRGEAMSVNQEGEELAMLLAAAFRARRAEDKSLTLATLQSEYGLPAVIVSRIENATKTPDRWNAATMASICKLLGADHPRSLAQDLRHRYSEGSLDAWLERIPGAEERTARTKIIVRELHRDLQNLPENNRASPLTPPSRHVKPNTQPNHLITGLLRLPVRGAPMNDGLIDPTNSNGDVIAPADAGPNSYALRMCRPSLGATIPGQAVLIVDPDRFPSNGGLAVLRDGALDGGNALRVITITSDKDGRMMGHSLNPEKQIPLDTVPASDLAMVTAVLLG